MMNKIRCLKVWKIFKIITDFIAGYFPAESLFAIFTYMLFITYESRDCIIGVICFYCALILYIILHFLFFTHFVKNHKNK